MELLLGFWFILFFVPAAFEDIKKQSLDLRLLLFFALPLPFLIFVTGGNIVSFSRMFGLGMGLVLYGLSVLSRGAIGRGDALVVMWLGYGIGVLALTEVLCLAWAGTFVLAAIMSLAKKKRPIPFLPFLGTAYYVFFAGLLVGGA